MGSICGSSKIKTKKDEENKENNIIPIPNSLQKISNNNNNVNANANENIINTNTNLIQQNHRQTNIYENNQELPPHLKTSNNFRLNQINNNNVPMNDRFNSSHDESFGLNWKRVNNIRRFENNQIRNNTYSDVRCPDCRYDFGNVHEFESHFPYCNLLRNNQAMNNRIHEILNLMQTLNQRVNESIIPENHANNGINNYDKPTELINWEYKTLENGVVLWSKVGKINLKEEDYKKINDEDKNKIKASKYWVKRIWLINYIRKHINDCSLEYTTLVINREKILQDSFLQFQTTMDLDLRKELKIFFVEEVAQDVGGVYREWYTNIIDSIFNIKEGLFYEVINKNYGQNSFFIPTYKEFPHKDESSEYYEFIGKVIAKAILDRMTMNISLNRILIKHILQMPIELKDLRYYDYEVYLSLENIMNNTIIKDNDLRFVWSIKTDKSTSQEVDLIPNGKDILVDDSNKQRFIQELIHFISYESIKEKLKAFLKGFRYLLKTDLLIVFTPEEFDFLISGQSIIDLKDWKKNTTYKGAYSENHPTIKFFWDVLSSLSSEELLVFYKFCTGSTRVPIDGFKSLQGNRNKMHKFCIDSGVPDKKDRYINSLKLIEANTCFNRIIMPCYKSKEELMRVVDIIIKNDTNYFGKQ